jgi:hypothetical protein
MREPRSPCASSLSVRHAGFEEGPDDLGLVPIRLRLGNPAQTAPTDPEPPLNHDGPEPLRELEFDRLHHGQLVLADVVVWPRLRETDGLSDHLKELQGKRPSVRSARGTSLR